MDIFNVLDNTKAIIHTFVRMFPLGLYSFSYLLATIYKDKRGAIILMGLLLNDLLGYSYKNYFKYSPNENCAMFSRKPDGTELGFLPNTHTEIISFLAGFIYSDMWKEYKFDFIPFTFIALMLILTIYSRISIGCKTPNDIVFNVIVGALLGMLFYYFVGKYYTDAKQTKEGNKTCNLGYNNYKCNEIRDGTVIIKNTEDTTNNTDKKTTYSNYYDE